MGLKEFVFGHKAFCVMSRSPKTRDCIFNCFASKLEAKQYMRKACDCHIQVRRQRKAFSELGEEFEETRRHRDREDVVKWEDHERGKK